MYVWPLQCSHFVPGIASASAVQEILSAEPVAEFIDMEEEEALEDSSLQEQDVMLDWKGDPMIVNPGDRLPFNFK